MSLESYNYEYIHVLWVRSTRPYFYCQHFLKALSVPCAGSGSLLPGCNAAPRRGHPLSRTRHTLLHNSVHVSKYTYFYTFTFWHSPENHKKATTINSGWKWSGERTQWTEKTANSGRVVRRAEERAGLVYTTYADTPKHSHPAKSNSPNGLALLTQPATPKIHFSLL